ncbi:hypothetical protein ACTJJ7_15980 [Phyllobacterium sp. 22229]|uniref:hypothetical protein n=1 Tax=Phyllobacterium sp. 22229 TaxID=3453895 RepID=UPI003F839FD9
MSDIRFSIDPRLVPPVKAARRLHLTLAEFEDKRRALEQIGFPEAFPITGFYDLAAIDAWLDRRSGLGNAGQKSVALDAKDVVAQRIAALG